jgi:hypothetical protein
MDRTWSMDVRHAPVFGLSPEPPESTASVGAVFMVPPDIDTMLMVGVDSVTVRCSAAVTFRLYKVNISGY